MPPGGELTWINSHHGWRGGTHRARARSLPRLAGVEMLSGYSRSDAALATYNPVDPPADIAALHEADTPKSIVQLQQFRQIQTVAIEAVGRQGTATLTELNPNINAWFLLALNWGMAVEEASYHQENPNQAGRTYGSAKARRTGWLLPMPPAPLPAICGPAARRRLSRRVAHPCPMSPCATVGSICATASRATGRASNGRPRA